MSAGCNGHGVCSDGRCQCDQGWKGVDCSQRMQMTAFFTTFSNSAPLIFVADCVVPDCSGHGQCVNGTCVCDSGWKGAACDTGTAICGCFTDLLVKLLSLFLLLQSDVLVLVIVPTVAHAMMIQGCVLVNP